MAIGFDSLFETSGVFWVDVENGTKAAVTFTYSEEEFKNNTADGFNMLLESRIRNALNYLNNSVEIIARAKDAK